jgi:hypothetical protein
VTGWLSARLGGIPRVDVLEGGEKRTRVRDVRGSARVRQRQQRVLDLAKLTDSCAHILGLAGHARPHVLACGVPTQLQELSDLAKREPRCVAPRMNRTG